jgi:superfamily II DNA or RNA helicase
MSRRFQRGDKVVVSALGNKVGIVDGEPRQVKAQWFYPVSFNPAEQSPWYPESALTAYVCPKTVIELLRDKEFVDPQDFIQALIYKKLERPLSDNLYTFYSSRTEFQVHQFKPVLKFLASQDQRLLLADEVGLGKTIEAAIVITEQQARFDGLARVLVVCPAMLTDKWKEELRRRFGLDFQVLRRRDLEVFLQRYTEYGEAERLKGICTLQTLRSAALLERLREVEPHFDIVVVDEAHHLRNPETLSSEAGVVVSELADALLFLSATPLHLGTPDLYNLLRILVPQEFPNFDFFQRLLEPNEYINNALRKLHDPKAALLELRRVEGTTQAERFRRSPYYSQVVGILTHNAELSRQQAVEAQRLLADMNSLSYVFTRTKKRDVQEAQFPLRQAKVIPVVFSPAERQFYDAVTEFVANQFRTLSRTRQGISFAVIMPQRQVASCIQAAKSSLSELIRKRRLSAPSQDDGDVIDPMADPESPFELDAHQLSSVETLLRAAENIGERDTKFEMFLKALAQLDRDDPDAKIIVFSFFKKTLNYLLRRLESCGYAGRVDIMHGDIKSQDRLRTIKKFRQDSHMKLLLSSEVGGEGLDFEFCNVIFNYDLPWNPMRVEQRIGRLDRYGQKHDKILIYNFSMKGTIDDEILNRLYLRINIFERYIGDLDVILGDQITHMTREIFSTALTHDERISIIDKVAENIERKRLEIERFEQESLKFIGQDAFFTEEITRRLRTKRFITAEEVEHFLQTFLHAKFPSTTLLPPKSGRSGVYVLKADDEFRRFVSRRCEGDENRKRVDKRLSQDGGCLLTFDYKVACEDQLLEFVTIHHPIIKAIKRYYDEQKTGARVTAQLSIQGRPADKGRYFFFVYLIEKTALKTELQMVPVLVNAESWDVKILDDTSDWFMAELVKATAPETASDYDNSQLEKAADLADEFLGVIRAEEEDKLRQSNNVLVDNRIESVKQSTAIKIGRAKETIQKLLGQGLEDDSPILRLHRGRIRNLEMGLDTQVGELEEKRGVSVGFTLIAGGTVQIGT